MRKGKRGRGFSNGMRIQMYLMENKKYAAFFLQAFSSPVLVFSFFF